MTQVLEIIDEINALPEGGAETVQAAAAAALAVEGIKSARACLTLVAGDEIRALNARMRGVDMETDVLSFPELNYPVSKTARDVPWLLARAYDPEYAAPFIGDIVLNVNRAREQAQEYGHSLERELGYLTAHAMFHLLGYDHLTDGDLARMRRMEKQAMRRIELYK